MKKAIVRIFVTSLLVGCATTGKFKTTMDSWLNNDVSQLIQAWGAPSSTFQVPNGNKIYTWLYVGGTVAYVNYNETLNMVTAGAYSYWCKVDFTANRDDRVVQWAAQGNNCKSK